jgi:DNA-binding MarR family transcriptional regulator
MEEAREAHAAARGLAAVIMAGNAYRAAAAKHYGLDVVGSHAVTYLDAYGPMPQARLAQLMGLTSGGVTGVVDRLERAQVARRATDPQDRRRHRVELTEQSAALIAQSRDALVGVFEVFEPAALATLVEALPLLAARLDERSRSLPA